MIFKLAVRFIRYRPALFAGAFIVMILGSMLIGMSAMGLSSAISAHDGDDDTMIVVMSLFGTLSGFIAFSIIAGTFALSVALRRREFALFRLNGGNGGQLRRMVMGEALIISLMASVIGSAFAYVGFGYFLDAINKTGIQEIALTASSPWLPLPIAFAIGTVIANLGAYSASSKASKIPPVEVLRDSDIDTNIMTKTRVIMGVIMSLCALTMYIIALTVNAGFEGAVPIVLLARYSLRLPQHHLVFCICPNLVI